MAIDPFIDRGRHNVETRRTTTQPVSGGYDISSYEHLLQGVSVATDRARVAGLLPKIGAGTIDHQIPQINFGQPKDHEENTAFDDTQQKLRAKEYLEDPTQFNPNTVGEGRSMDGAIEPLDIRDVATFESIDSPFIARSVKGVLEGGNQDIFGAHDVQMQFIPLPFLSATIVEPYEDSDDRIGTLLTASVVLPGFLTNLRRIIHPFDDSTILSGTLVGDADIDAVLLTMTGSVDDDFRPRFHKSAAAGFTYDNNRPGTDSIAFGGLLNGGNDD